MKTKYILYLITLFLFAGLLSACTGGAMASNSWPGITVDEEKAYVTYNQHVYAINLANGTEKWRYPAEPDNKISFFAEPELSPDGQLIVGSYNYSLYSLDPANGQLKWRPFTQSKDRYIGGPLASDTGIYAPSADKNLYALDKNGNFLWSFPTGEPLWAQPATNDTCDCVYLTSMDHQVYSIDAQSGREKWKTEELGGAIVGTPAFSQEGKLYVGTFGNEMLALDANNGKVLWRYSTEDWVWSGPALEDEVLYFGDLNGNFYAINATDGSELWKVKWDGKIVSTPMVNDDMIVFTTEAGIAYAYDKDGIKLWEYSSGGKLYSPPVAAGDLILVAPIETENNTLLVALSADGVQKWSFSIAR